MTDEHSPDWEVPASEDEEQEGSAEAEGDAIPTRVLLLYKQIERDGFIELKTKECRRVKSTGEATTGECVEKSADVTEREYAEDVVTTADLEGERERRQEKKCLTPSAFDYDEELDSGMDHLPKRTPKSDRKTRKRVGMFQDVVSDLKRYRDLDAQVVTKDQPVETKGNEVDDEKESKNKIPQQNPDADDRESTSLFTQQSSTSDIKEGMSSQLSNIENILASQKPSET